MSRSFRRTSVTGMTTARSEKWHKRRARHVWRQAAKVALREGQEVLPLLREVSSVWLMPKDGKQWFDPRAFPQDMRK